VRVPQVFPEPLVLLEVTEVLAVTLLLALGSLRSVVEAVLGVPYLPL
jgi:hypothetical protein